MFCLLVYMIAFNFYLNWYVSLNQQCQLVFKGNDLKVDQTSVLYVAWMVDAILVQLSVGKSAC